MKTLIPLLLLIITGCDSFVKIDKKENEAIKQLIIQKLDDVKISYDAILVEGTTKKKKITLFFKEDFKFVSIDMINVLSQYIQIPITDKYNIPKLKIISKKNKKELVTFNFTYKKPTLTAQQKSNMSRLNQMVVYCLQNFEKGEYLEIQDFANEIIKTYHLKKKSFLDILLQYGKHGKKTLNIDNDDNDYLIGLMLFYIASVEQSFRDKNINEEIPVYPEVSKEEEESILFCSRTRYKLVELLKIAGVISTTSECADIAKQAFRKAYKEHNNDLPVLRIYKILYR